MHSTYAYLTVLCFSSSFLAVQSQDDSKECTILVRSDLRFDAVDENAFECILDPSDADGVESISAPIDLTEAQMGSMKEMVAEGKVISNLSTLNMPNKFDPSDGIVRIPRTLLDLEQIISPNINSRIANNVTGEKPILVVKVKDSEGKARSESLAEISDDIFGSFGDTMTLKSQMFDCSFGKLNIIPGPTPGGGNEEDKASPGVVEVNIDIPLTNNSRQQIRNKVTRAVSIMLGFNLPGPYQQVMYVLEGCYGQDCGWAAYAFINSWNSVYQGVYYKMVGVQMHGELLLVVDI